MLSATPYRYWIQQAGRWPLPIWMAIERLSYTFFDRQLSLHEMYMMAHRLKLMPLFRCVYCDFVTTPIYLLRLLTAFRLKLSM